MVKPIKGFKQATPPPAGITAMPVVSQSLSSHLLTSSPPPKSPVQGTTSSSIKSDYVSPPKIDIVSPPSAP